jgi:DNA-binding Lrp family transcriptional regulator
MMGLFLISDAPLSPERIAERLKVSRASVSTNLRIFTTTGICDDVSVAGDRRRYYVMREDAFARHMEANMGILRKLTELCRGAVGVISPGRGPARRRLQEALAYCEFIEKEIAATLARWRSRRFR